MKNLTMNGTVQIRELDRLITGTIGPNKFVTKCTTRPLVEPGENYGSILMSVIVEIQDDPKKSTELHLVAKMSPTNPWIKKIFNTPVTFKNEIGMYNSIVPTLIEFQQQQGVVNVISCCPKYYGARISLNPESDDVDDDAVILLENLKCSGFILLDRMEGADFDVTKSILRDLAVFHAVPIALKLMEPDIFNSKILQCLNITGQPYHEAVFQNIADSVIDNVIGTAKLNKDCIPLLDKVRTSWNLCNEVKPPQEPFATVNHDDLWINNIMLKIINPHTIECKFIDYQTISYGSPCNDIIFFLYTSVQPEVLRLYFDEFIRHYYETFIRTLDSLKCEKSPFSYDLFLKEIEESAKSQFKHILHMHRPIFTPKGTPINISEIMENPPKGVEFISQKYEERVAEVILEFSKKNWI